MINLFKKVYYKIPYTRGSIRDFAFNQNESVEIDIDEKYKYDGDLLKIFSENSGPVVHKWHHYIPIYSRYFSSFRATKVRFLEIGVSKGGSLTMWRKYLGEDAIIFGIDINPDCAQYDNISGSVRIGSQTDEEFLKSVVEAIKLAKNFKKDTIEKDVNFSHGRSDKILIKLLDSDKFWNIKCQKQFQDISYD